MNDEHLRDLMRIQNIIISRLHERDISDGFVTLTGQQITPTKVAVEVGFFVRSFLNLVEEIEDSMPPSYPREIGHQMILASLLIAFDIHKERVEHLRASGFTSTDKLRKDAE